MIVRLLSAVALVCAIAMPARTQAADPDGIAVVIGNARYAAGIPSVDFAHRDAEAMTRFLIETAGFRPGNVIGLRDAGQAALFSAFGNREDHRGRLWGAVRPGQSDVVVYYSGHGVPGQRSGRGYLLPVDADPATPEINGYPLDLLIANLAKLNARSVTLIIDACFSGDSHGGRLIQAASPVYLKAALPDALPAGMTVLTAARANELASWDANARHGLFTHHFLNALHGGADAAGNGDGAVTVTEIEAYLGREMTYAARRAYLREQHATVAGDAGRVLLRHAPGQPPRRPEISIAAATAPPPAGAAKPTPAVGVAAPPKPVPPARQGRVIRDCDICPEMVAIPPGRFTMGSERSVLARSEGAYDEKIDDEYPPTPVTIARGFAIGIFEVTISQFTAFQNATGHSLGSECHEYQLGGGWRRGQGALVTLAVHTGPRELRRLRSHGAKGERVMHCVSWQDARAYAEWLSRRTGKRYRLPSEAEWEYAARAGSTTLRPWSDSAASACQHANVSDRFFAEMAGKHPQHNCNDERLKVAEAGLRSANAFGLYDMIGNVREWVADCHAGHDGRPRDQAPRQDGNCDERIHKGGSWFSHPFWARSGERDWDGPHWRSEKIGFRLVRELD